MKLKGNWGIVDIEDVCAGAEYLVEKGQVQGGEPNLDGMVFWSNHFFELVVTRIVKSERAWSNVGSA